MLVDSIHIRFLTAARQYANYRLVTWIDQYSAWWKELRTYGVPIRRTAMVNTSCFCISIISLHFSWNSTAAPREGRLSRINRALYSIC